MDVDKLPRRAAGGEPVDRVFTLHVEFLAADPRQALIQAAQYAEALSVLRAEVDCYQARVSARGDWETSAAVYCREPGPHAMDICLEPAGHSGYHQGAGVTDSWTDSEVPAAPDTIAGLDDAGPTGDGG